ncbi:MAG: hypothetical protein J7518_01140 [Nocardioidaceae bacterium]|nr:hypothetical protein [Nocardioidaceae bacterium]
MALYSHDTQGLGHVRRNSLLAAAIVATDPDVSVLLLSGAREAVSLPLPERTEVVVVPGIAKDRTGRYSSRFPGCSLPQVVAMRAAVAEAVLASYAPDVLVVDKWARGFRGELEPAIRRLREEHGTRTVLGLRDVLDDVETTRREWAADGTTEAIDSLYDEVWAYTDPTVFDPAEVYGWERCVRAKVRYPGYLGSGRARLLPSATGPYGARPALPELRRPFVLGLVGGGQDGEAVVASFLDASFPAGHDGVLVAGPYLPGPLLAAAERTAARRPDLRVYRFVADVPRLTRAASAIVTMGGYNSVCEVVVSRRPALVVPRVRPRGEQALRAAHFARRGLLDVACGDHLGADDLTRWLSAAVGTRPAGRPPVDLGGLGRVPALAAGLVGRPVGPARRTADVG